MLKEEEVYEWSKIGGVFLGGYLIGCYFECGKFVVYNFRSLID